MLQKFLSALGLCIVLCLFSIHALSQGVAINTDGSDADNSAILDVKSTNAGILVPRMTQAQRDAISGPATGLMIFQADNTPGFYYNAGTSVSPSWIKLSVPTDNFNDADADATNELQSLSISGHDISLSDGGGTVTVPDNNTTYSAGNQLSLSGTTFNVTEGSSSGLDADMLDGHDWSEITGANGWIDDGSTVRLETAGDLVGIGTATPQSQLHMTGNLQIGTDGLSTNHLLTTWTENGYETNFFFRETPTHGMGIRYNATDNKLYFDRYPDQATPIPLFALQRDAAVIEFESVLDMQSNQIQDLNCDGGTTDAATCGWVNANDDNTTYSAGTGLSLSGTTFNNTGDLSASNEIQSISISGHDITLSNGGGTVTVPDNNTTYAAGNQLSLSGTTFNVSEGAGSGLDSDMLDGQHWSDIQAWVNTNDDSGTDDQTLAEVLTEGNSNGGTDIIMTTGTSLENQESDKNITLLDDNPTWHGNTYGGITQFHGDGVLNMSKLEAGALYLERDIEVVGAYYDSNSDAGNSGTLLSSTGTGTAWTEPWTLSANIASSPDDFGSYDDGSLSGDDTESTVTMPFSVTYGGVAYNQIVISINGWVTFGTGSNGSYSNSSLPSSSFAGPTVFAYWDDLESEGNNVRYGDVGSSPNRVYIIDYEAQTLSGDYNVRFQIQIHETSGLINVRYRNEMSPSANGQSATIGFQTAGGSTAKAYPIVYNGKVLDDNRDDSEGWSVCPVR